MRRNSGERGKRIDLGTKCIIPFYACRSSRENGIVKKELTERFYCLLHDAVIHTFIYSAGGLCRNMEFFCWCCKTEGRERLHDEEYEEKIAFSK